jgi:hypothetical protein
MVPSSSFTVVSSTEHTKPLKVDEKSVGKKVYKRKKTNEQPEQIPVYQCESCLLLFDSECKVSRHFIACSVDRIDLNPDEQISQIISNWNTFLSQHDHHSNAIVSPSPKANMCMLFHTPMYYYICPCCLSAFKNIETFILHLNIDLDNSYKDFWSDIHKLRKMCPCLICIYCSKVFSSVSTYNKHVANDFQNYGPNICEACNKRFMYPCSLTHHCLQYESCLPRTKIIKCIRCAAGFPSKIYFEIHKHLCQGFLYKCPYCHHYFRENEVAGHKETHKKAQKDIEDQVQKINSSWKHPKKSNNGKVYNSRSTSPNSELSKIFDFLKPQDGPRSIWTMFNKFNDTLIPVLASTVFICPYCYMLSDKIESFKNHVGLIFTCDSELFSKCYQVKCNPMKILCPLCAKSSSNIETHNMHISKHFQRQDFPCDLCKQSFVRVCQLNNHVCVINEMHISCINCKVTFPTRLSYLIHLKKCSIVNARCHLCQTQFSNTSQLKTHDIKYHCKPLTPTVLEPIQSRVKPKQSKLEPIQSKLTAAQSSSSNTTTHDSSQLLVTDCVLKPKLPQSINENHLQTSIYDFLECQKCKNQLCCITLEKLKATFCLQPLYCHK